MHHGIMVSLEQGLASCIAFWCNPDEKEITEEALDRVAHSYPLRGQKLLGASKVRRLLEQSHIDEALAVADRIGLTKNSRFSETIPMRDRGDWMLAGLEIGLARSEYEIVLVKINHQLKEASLQERDRDRIELHLIAADAQQRLGRSSKAIHHFAMAIALATPGNVIQPFKVRAALLKQFFLNTKDKEFGLIRPTERLFLERLRFDESHSKHAPTSHQMTPAGVDESSTALAIAPSLREIQLLNLLSEGLSNEQAADRLSLSIPTIKWHLHNLYNKLGVRNRSAALARARSLKLIR
jgi:LuxR family maltose regulon positive regulatory protein